MKIQHHLSDELLLEYAAGGLAEGWSLAVATHLSLCPDCRRRLGLMEQTGGVLLGAMRCDEPATADSWSSMKARLSSGSEAMDAATGVLERPAAVSTKPSAVPSKPVQVGRPHAILPQPLRAYLGSDVDGLKWRSLGRGAYHIPIAVSDNETSVRLLRIPAGKPVPEHSHGGRELTLVLAGSFRDGKDRFARGDIEEADESLQHQPIADDGEDCICLAVTDAPLKFRSWVMKMVQPVLGI